MASPTTELESALRVSLLNILRDRARGMARSVDVDGAIADVLASVRRTVAEFASESNSTRPPGRWYGLPPELRLETVRWLAPAPRAKMLRVSRDIRDLLLSDTSLWTTIAVPGWYNVPQKRSLALSRMVGRSGNRPLDLEWFDSPSYTCGNLDPASVAIQEVTPRIRTLVINAAYVNAGAVTIWAKDMPLLEKLAITGSTSCVISPETWRGSRAPRLREIRLPVTTLAGSPCDAFHSVVHFEAIMGYDAQEGSWDSIWAWFPQLQCLILHVGSSEPLTLPPPPDSLRRVVLHDTSSCESPGLLVRDWKTHGVRLLEIFSNASSALALAARYLRACDPSPWTASLVEECCPSDGFRAKSVLRAENSTVIVRSRWMREVAGQLRAAHAKKVLISRPRELTISRLDAFDGTISFTHLRALTIIDSTGDFSRVLEYDAARPTRIRALKLRHLVVDLTPSPSPLVVFGYLHELISRVLILNSEHRLRELIVRLPESVDRQSDKIASFPKKVAHISDDVRIEYLPQTVPHDDSCPRVLARD